MRNTTYVWMACLAGALLIPTGAARTAQGVATYAITDLGTLGGERSSAMGVNNPGHVVGAAETSDGRTRAFMYTGGSLVDLGTFGGDESFAYGINDNGLVVGRAQASDGRFRAFVTRAGGGLTDLTALDSRVNGAFGTAFGINAAGDVAGYFTTPGQHMEAHNRVFVYRDFQITDLGTFGGNDGIVTAINDAGDLVGYFGTSPHADYADHQAFLLRGGKLIPLGSLGGKTTSARDVNRRGDVVGDGQDVRGEPRAFLYQDGAIRDLGTLPGGRQSAAFAISETGDIVGRSDAADQRSRAVLVRGNAMIDLNERIPPGSGWVLSEGRDINERGQIVGTGWLHGQQRAFLLSPVP